MDRHVALGSPKTTLRADKSLREDGVILSLALHVLAQIWGTVTVLGNVRVLQ